jgi:tetratricopeptide (TPR) repeat protein
VSFEATVDRILSAVDPAQDLDAALLRRLLLERAEPSEAVGYLREGTPVAEQRAAVLYLGMYGSMRECPVLALCLQHPDEHLAELAENALWLVWMQAGSQEGNAQLTRGILRLQANEVAGAIRTLSLLGATEPQFAEAHFQLGLALITAGRTPEAVRTFRQTLRLNPYHFAAAAALGHAYLEEGHLEAAAREYAHARQLHPRLKDVPEAARQVESILAQRRRTVS